MRDIPITLRPLFLVCALVATLFVIYGSLVPFVLRPHSFSAALSLFSDIRYLQLGASSRADLLANALIYMPVSMFWMAVIAPHGVLKGRRVLAIGVLTALILLSFVIEFLQLYVAPRTVSKNDIIAESIGILIGATLWVFAGPWLSRGIQRLVQRGRIGCDTLLLLYVLIVIVYSLMPFDFFISAAEVRSAVKQRGWPLLGNLFNGGSFSVSLQVIFISLLEFVIAFGIGFIAYRTKLLTVFSRGQLVLLAFVTFLLIEGIQFFEYSGISTLWSAIVKSVGVYVGLLAASRLDHTQVLGLVRLYRRSFLSLLVPFYLLVVLTIKGWPLRPEFDLNAIQQLLSEVSFIPFYYHYFTTEMAALKSALMQIVIVSPLVLYFWASDIKDRDVKGVHSTAKYHRMPTRMIFAALLATLIELGGLLWGLLRPDFTNILIIAISVPFIYGFIELLYRSLFNVDAATFDSVSEGSITQTLTNVRTSPTHPHKSLIVVGIVCGAMALIYLVNYPLSQLFLCLSAVGYIAILYRYPTAALIAIPAGIPIMNLYPLSGRFFLSEFDFLILITLASQYISGHVDCKALKSDRSLCWVIVGFSAVLILSSLHVLWGQFDLDIRSFSSFYSPFNVLRLGKAWLWFVLFLPVLFFYFRRYPNSFLRFSQGMLVGLSLLLMAVLAERFLFTGLLGFDEVLHRVRGSFVSMHTGGGHIDAYLVTALPFLIVPFISRAGVLVRGLAILGFLVTFYAIFVTYSRGPYIIATLVILILLIGFTLSARRQTAKRMAPVMAVCALLIAVGWAGLPFMFDSFLTKRLAIVEHDKDIRVSQWSRVIDLVPQDISSQLLGVGPGMLPRSIMLSNLESDRPSGMHVLLQENGNQYLSLSYGRSLYTNQYISINQGESYQYQFRYRSIGATARIGFDICEKWIDDSFRCQNTALELSPSDDWREVVIPVSIDAFPASNTQSRSWRPKTLAIYVGAGTQMDLDDISLNGDLDESVVKNGDFSQGKDYWYITSDSHLDWHAKNLLVNVYHDLGILGLVAFIFLSGLALRRIFQGILLGDRRAVIMLGSLSGFLGVGVVASLFEVPQLSFMFYLLVAVAALIPVKVEPSITPTGLSSDH